MKRLALQGAIVLLICTALSALVWLQWQHLTGMPPPAGAPVQNSGAVAIHRSPKKVPQSSVSAQDDRSADERSFRASLAADVSHVLSIAADGDQENVNRQMREVCVDALPLLKDALAQKGLAPDTAKRISEALDTVKMRLKLGIDRQKTEQWYQANTLDILERHEAARESPCDAARFSVAAQMRLWSHIPFPSGDEDMIIWNEGNFARMQRDHDPLALYVYGRILMDYPGPGYEYNLAQAVLDEAQKGMQKSDYPAFLKLAAALRLAECIHLTRTTDVQDQKKIDHLIELADSYFPQILADDAVPREEWLGLFDLIEEVSKVTRGDRGELTAPLFDQLQKSNVDKSTVLTVQGCFSMENAWDARGDQWADSVTPRGWELMGQRLIEAQNALEEAWQLDPSNYRAANEMIDVELGQGQGRDRMEMWFERAMEVFPDNYAACAKKLYYLEPKWYGSKYAMKEFGRECLAHANWRAGIPMILIDAHLAIARYGPDGWQPELDPKYFQDNDEAWQDISHVYAGIFAHGFASNRKKLWYARLACLCGHWAQANHVFNETGNWFDPEVFDSGEFRNSKIQAAEHAKAMDTTSP